MYSNSFACYLTIHVLNIICVITCLPCTCFDTIIESAQHHMCSRLPRDVTSYDIHTMYTLCVHIMCNCTALTQLCIYIMQNVQYIMYIYHKLHFCDTFTTHINHVYRKFVTKCKIDIIYCACQIRVCKLCTKCNLLSNVDISYIKHA